MQKRDHELFCNCCGAKIVTGGYKDREEYLDITKEWGFFSRNKDGQIHHFHLCETCYDNWTAGFALPVQVTEQTEMV